MIEHGGTYSRRMSSAAKTLRVSPDAAPRGGADSHAGGERVLDGEAGELALGLGHGVRGEHGGQALHVLRQRVRPARPCQRQSPGPRRAGAVEGESSTAGGPGHLEKTHRQRTLGPRCAAAPRCAWPGRDSAWPRAPALAAPGCPLPPSFSERGGSRGCVRVSIRFPLRAEWARGFRPLHGDSNLQGGGRGACRVF